MGLKDQYVDQSHWDRAITEIYRSTAVSEIKSYWDDQLRFSKVMVDSHKVCAKKIPWFRGRQNALDSREDALNNARNAFSNHRTGKELVRRGYELRRTGVLLDVEVANASKALAVDTTMVSAWKLIVDNHEELRKFMDHANRPKLYAAKRYLILRDALQDALNDSETATE